MAETQKYAQRKWHNSKNRQYNVKHAENSATVYIISFLNFIKLSISGPAMRRAPLS